MEIIIAKVKPSHDVAMFLTRPIFHGSVKQQDNFMKQARRCWQ